jgi:hypothetical protein
MLAAAMRTTASQTRPRCWVTRRAMNFEYDISDRGGQKTKVKRSGPMV